ncbi:MAG TPA: phosphoribosylformylglycinamidine cyclo-ligase [Candidatus Margulisiibacteriota bacterium]|nr:phosphoribosylformylglycinamidine cyclo-ligase [Candidatus Margulisiibacteriota bacterium]
MQKITYKSSGVDIQKASLFKRKIKFLAKSSCRSEVLKEIGGFGSFFSFAKNKFRDPVLISSADGVGTKLKVALLANKHDTVGIDAVAMNVNDILCTGAEPLFFLDYIAYSKVKESILLDVVKGINMGCIDSGCSLVGGETAQMPGMYKDGEYDLAGFCVGVAERKDIIDGSKIKPGDVIIGLESNGLHSNGYSLVRKVLSQAELKRMSAGLLKPTRIYVKPVLSLLKRFEIKGISHITGGAFYDKVSRILPGDTDARIYKNSWVAPAIFRLIQNKGNVPEQEMYHTLNMGMGMVLMVKDAVAQPVIARLASFGLKSRIIGEIVKGKKSVEIV